MGGCLGCLRVHNVEYEHLDCPTCGRSFPRKPGETWKKFCCGSCAMQHVNCMRCGKEFARKPKDNWRICCNKACYDMLLVTKKCEKCGCGFQTTNEKRWMRYCGRFDCVPPEMRGKSSHTRKSYSHKAIVWLEQIAQTEKIDIQHAENGGEHSIPRGNYHIKFDGWCGDTNTAYEFHGDYWHGNPSVYKPEDINPDRKCTFGELYKKTMEREQFIRNQGIKLITIWESEFDKSCIPIRPSDEY